MKIPALEKSLISLCSFRIERFNALGLCVALAVTTLLAPVSATLAAGPRPTIDVTQRSQQEAAAGAVRVRAGDLVNYQIVLSGDSRYSAYGLQVIETWPEGLEFIDASATPVAATVFDPVTRELTWFIDAPAGSTATLDVIARPQSTVMGETLKSTISLKGDEGLLANVDSPQAIAVQSSANVDLEVSVTSSNVRMGDLYEVTYVVTIVNSGPESATDVVLEAIIDAITLDAIEEGSFNNVPAGACDVDTLICQLGDLDVGASIQLEAVALVHIDSAPISIFVDFRASSNDIEVDAMDNQAFASESLPEVEDEGGGAMTPGLLLALLLLARRRARGMASRGATLHQGRC